MNILCTICSDLVDHETILFTKCGHIFHHHCLAQWIERSRSCPQCRHKLTDTQMYRVYPTIANECSAEDTATLQSKLDDAQLQLRQTRTLINEKEDKLNALMLKDSSLQEHIKKVELKLASRDAAVSALKDQLSYCKIQVNNANKLKEDYESLKAALKAQTGLQKVLNETTTEVENMLKENVDTRSLAVYVVALKKALCETEKKKNEVRDKLNSVRQQLALQKKYNVEQKAKIAEQEEIISNAERRYKTLKYKRKVSGGEEAQDPVLAKQPRLDATAVSDTSLNAMAERIQNADSPYLSLKQNSLMLGALDGSFNCVPDHWALKPSDVAMIKSARTVSLTQLGNSSNSIFHTKTQLKPESHKNEQPDISYDGLGGHSKLDIFPKPRPAKSLVPKLTAKHRLQKPGQSGSQDISKLLNKTRK